MTTGQTVGGSEGQLEWPAKPNMSSRL